MLFQTMKEREDSEVQSTDTNQHKRSNRFKSLDEKPVNQDGFAKEWPEEGLIAMDSPNDPDPSVAVEGGEIVEMDGKQREDFDFIDFFIADYAINVEKAEEALAIDSVEFAQRLVDINIPREDIIELTTAMTPAKLAEVVNQMNTLEMMMALQKMRARKTPGNQGHCTSVKDHPVQIAADAAEAALRGFDEIETTVGVARYAPFNALAQQLGSQAGRGGVLTQCAVEEATELELGMKGLTTYAETVSVYGTESVFKDGDDTPWSKAFLASGYASRGLKMRFTSGSGSEVNMGQAEGKSMVYLESRCVLVTKGCGVQGLQNGGISCIAIPSAVPSGIRGVLAENLITTMVDLEVASGNDQTFSHSHKRQMARTFPQLVAGTDLIFSGYSTMPNYDDMFAGSNFDSYDYDDYNVVQRDLKVDGGLKPIAEEDAIAVRNTAARAIQVVFRELGFPQITDEEVEAATYGDGSDDMPDRDQAADLKAAEELMDGDITGLDIVEILAKHGFDDLAENMLNMLKQRISGDYLHTSAVIDGEFNVTSGVNDRNDYQGPGTGYRMSEERWEEIKDIRHAFDPKEI